MSEIWHTNKKHWQTNITSHLHHLNIPPQHALTCTARLTFPDRRRRDSDNYSALLSKALGDALQTHWIPDDTPKHYQFQPVTFIGKGPKQTEILITTGVQPSIFTGA